MVYRNHTQLQKELQKREYDDLLLLISPNTIFFEEDFQERQFRQMNCEIHLNSVVYFLVVTCGTHIFYSLSTPSPLSWTLRSVLIIFSFVTFFFSRPSIYPRFAEFAEMIIAYGFFLLSALTVSILFTDQFDGQAVDAWIIGNVFVFLTFVTMFLSPTGERALRVRSDKPTLLTYS